MDNPELKILRISLLVSQRSNIQIYQKKKKNDEPSMPLRPLEGNLAATLGASDALGILRSYMTNREARSPSASTKAAAHQLAILALQPRILCNWCSLDSSRHNVRLRFYPFPTSDRKKFHCLQKGWNKTRSNPQPSRPKIIQMTYEDIESKKITSSHLVVQSKFLEKRRVQIV